MVVVHAGEHSRVQRQLKASARVAVVRHDTDARSVNSQRLDYEVKAEADTPQAQAQAYADLLDRLATDAAAAVAGVTALAAPATAAPAGR